MCLRAARVASLRILCRRPSLLPTQGGQCRGSASLGSRRRGEGGAEGGAPAPFAGFAAPTIDGGKPAEGGLVFGAAAPAPAAGDDGADGAEEPSAGPGPEEESTAEFTPVVQLDEVEVRTHEEEESVEFKMRAKLYRFAETMLNVGSGKKEWIERGIGEIKLLKHKESEKIRLLMRQEDEKVIVNHVADPRISLQVRATRAREIGIAPL